MNSEYKISSFRDEYFFLSNFYEAPVEVDGITYQNGEAAFQAGKVVSVEDRRKFCNLNPPDAKRMGRSVSLRKDWEYVKIQWMEKCIECKFSQNEELAEKLVQTGDAYLEEGNDWGDKVWGTVNGNGRNLLGQILMDTREKLAEKEQEMSKS